MSRPPVIRAFLGDDEIIVDLFAGGGGASTGIHRATGRSPDIAINHSPEAIAGEEYVIVDIGMRMLTPRELFRAQGFPDSYVIDPIGPNGKPLSKTAQVRACGNAVPPHFVEAIIGAAFARAG